MQVVVKKPHIRIDGEITRPLVEYLRSEFGEIEIIENEDEELVEVIESNWYRSIRSTMQPGDNMRVYRKLEQLDSARDLDDLKIPPGSRLEALSGNRDGLHSIRINDQYRVCLEWNTGNADNVEIVDYH